MPTPTTTVATNNDLLSLLDGLLEPRGAEWWTRFYTDPQRKCPFFTQNPDESLVELLTTGVISKPMRVLELGCGNGRNANYLASRGFDVDAVDFSASSIAQARATAAKSGSAARFHCQSIFDFQFAASGCDLVYDSGCFHHIPPHRRLQYLDLVSVALRPEGIFSLVCFAPEGGSGFTDLQVYENRSMGGGLGFSEEQIRSIFAGRFRILTFRRVKEQPEGSGLFGKQFLWVTTMKKPSHAPAPLH